MPGWAPSKPYTPQRIPARTRGDAPLSLHVSRLHGLLPNQHVHVHAGRVLVVLLRQDLRKDRTPSRGEMVGCAWQDQNSFLHMASRCSTLSPPPVHSDFDHLLLTVLNAPTHRLNAPTHTDLHVVKQVQGKQHVPPDPINLLNDATHQLILTCTLSNRSSANTFCSVLRPSSMLYSVPTCAARCGWQRGRGVGGLGQCGSRCGGRAGVGQPLHCAAAGRVEGVRCLEGVRCQPNPPARQRRRHRACFWAQAERAAPHVNPSRTSRREESAGSTHPHGAVLQDRSGHAWSVCKCTNHTLVISHNCK